MIPDRKAKPIPPAKSPRHGKATLVSLEWLLSALAYCSGDLRMKNLIFLAAVLFVGIAAIGCEKKVTTEKKTVTTTTSPAG